MQGAAIARPSVAHIRGSAPRAAADAPRCRAVRLIFLIYFLFLIEGVLRKWLTPSAASALYFLRDPFVFVLYFMALASGLFGNLGGRAIWMTFAAVSSLWGLLGHVIGGHGIVAWMLGVRTYWLYMPIAFVVATAFRKQDISRFVRLNLLIAIPYALLIVTQYRSDPGALINRAIDENEQVTVVLGDIVRPYGVFSYYSQNVWFTASLVALMAVAWLRHRDYGISRPILWLGASGVAVMSVLTGSRMIYFLIAGIFAGMLLVMAFSCRQADRGKAVGFAVLFVAAGTLLLATTFEPMMRAMLERQSGAVEEEGSTLARALNTAGAALFGLTEAPMVGYGIGTGTSSVARFMRGGVQVVTAENELERINFELGPIVGLIFAGLRLGFAIWLMVAACRAARRGEAQALPLAGFAAPFIQQGFITFSTLPGFVAWLYVGLVLALVRLSREESHSDTLRAGPS